MSRTPLPPDVEQILKDRLPYSFSERLPEQLMLVTTGGAMGNQTHQMDIILTVAGWKPGEIRALNAYLVERLRGALNPRQLGRDITDREVPDFPDASSDAYDPWMYSIYFGSQFEGDHPRIFVEFNQPDFLGYASIDAVLGVVRGILAPIARERSRKLVILQGVQRYVPLDFEMDDILRRTMSVVLPEGLQAVDAHHIGDEYDVDPARRACKSLTTTLGFVTPLRSTCVSHIEAQLTHDGRIKIWVSFKPGRMPSAIEINAVQRAIMEVLKLQVVLPHGFFFELVFDSANPAFDEDGDYDEDARMDPEF